MSNAPRADHRTDHRVNRVLLDHAFATGAARPRGPANEPGVDPFRGGRMLQLNVKDRTRRGGPIALGGQ
jgi:hypothetical protein